MKNLDFLKEVLNCYLNAKILPKTDFYFLIGKYPYLGKPTQDFCPKLAISDFDGVFNRKDSPDLYMEIFKNMAKENPKIRKNFEKILKIDKKIRTPEDVEIAEKEFSKIFKKCKLKKEEFENACEEVAKEFLKFSLVRGAKSCVYRLQKELGYVFSIISGSPRKALEKIGKEIGISTEYIYGTEYFFDKKGNFLKLKLVLGSRKNEKKEQLLQKNIQNKYGCCFIFEDEPILNAPYMKAGINPSIIIGKPQPLPFDIFAFCPQARENLEELVKEVYKFEYGWVSIHSLEEWELKRIIELSNKIKKIDLSVPKNKREFCKILIEIVELKEKYKLISSPSLFKNLIFDLIQEEDQEKCKTLMKKIWKISVSRFPELNF